MTVRDGFIIPNVATVLGNSLVSEPDQGDFVILGNQRFGVISGCKIELEGSNVVVGSGPNRCVVDGDVFSLAAATSRSLNSAEAYARFDLVVYDTASNHGLYVVVGTASANPVWPDITDTMCVLAEVYTPASGSGGTRLITDKRNIMASGVYGYNVDKIVVSLGADGAEKFSIGGDGTLTWSGFEGGSSALVYNETNGELTFDAPVVIADYISATTTLKVGGQDVVTKTTIERSSSAPGYPGVGKVWSDSDTGVVSVYDGTAWVPLAPVPVGTIIQNITPPNTMAEGWLPMSGGTYTVGTGAGHCSASLFALGTSLGWVSSGVLTLPNWNQSSVATQYGPLQTTVGTETTVVGSFRTAIQGRGNQVMFTHPDFRFYSYIRN